MIDVKWMSFVFCKICFTVSVYVDLYRLACGKLSQSGQIQGRIDAEDRYLLLLADLWAESQTSTE